MTPRFKGVLIAFVGMIFWATTGVLISYLLRNYDLQPLTLAFWRDLMVAGGLFVILGVVQPKALVITRRDVPFFIAYGFVGLAIFNSLWTVSVQYNGAAVATVLAYSSPAFTVLLSRPILHEPFTGRKMAAVGLSLIGCVLVVKAYSPEMWQVNPVGILVGLGTGMAFGMYTVAGRWSSKRFPNAWTVTAYGFLFAAGGLALTQRPDTLFTMREWSGWAILAVLAFGPSLIGFGLYTLSMRYVQASVASLIASLEPALTAIMAVFFLGEILTGWQWLGAGLILAAVVLSQIGVEPSLTTASPAAPAP